MKHDDVIATTLRGVWPSLPALLAGSAGVCVAAVVPVIVAPGINPVALMLTAVVVVPFVAALVAVVDDISDGTPATIGAWWRELGALWRWSAGLGLLAAVPASLFLAAVEAVSSTGSPLMWPSFAVTGAATVIAVLGLMAALPLGAAHRQLRGWALWMASLYVISRHPVRFVAVATTIVGGVWAATALSASLLLLVPAPAAIVAVTATWTSTPDTLTRR
jgi:hypothetical protein